LKAYQLTAPVVKQVSMKKLMTWIGFAAIGLMLLTWSVILPILGIVYLFNMR